MKFPFLRLNRSGLVVVLIVLAALAPIATSALVHAEQNTEIASQADHDTAVAYSLHNPNFDNGHWYEFDHRYDSSYPSGVWVPAGTDMSDLVQDWRLWFLDGTDIVDCDPDTDYPHSGDESVKIRSFTWSSLDRQVAGLYQVIPDVVPCRSYKFQMYAYSRQKESGDWLADLKVGIEPTGWHPDSLNDPAVHNWPSTMVWGTSHTEYTSGYGLLEVIAEPFDTEITVFLYADARGGNSHRIHWDTGSFQSVSSSDNLLADPNDRVVNDSEITGPTAEPWGDWSAIKWTTKAESLNQVYYRFVSGLPPTPATAIYSDTLLYFPLLQRSPNPWMWTDVDDTPGLQHNVSILGLKHNSTYEYFVVSRGFWGGQCTLWVSEVYTFITGSSR